MTITMSYSSNPELGRHIKSVSNTMPYYTYLEDDEELPISRGEDRMPVKDEPLKWPYPVEVTGTDYLTLKHRHRAKVQNQMARKSRQQNRRKA